MYHVEPLDDLLDDAEQAILAFKSAIDGVRADSISQLQQKVIGTAQAQATESYDDDVSAQGKLHTNLDMLTRRIIEELIKQEDTTAETTETDGGYTNNDNEEYGRIHDSLHSTKTKIGEILTIAI